MRSALFFLFILVGCRTHPSPPAKTVRLAKPADWKADGNLTQEEGDQKCIAELPNCKRAFAVYDQSASPCANRGTVCREFERVPSGHWTCHCDECLDSSECQPTQHCGTGVPPCSSLHRVPLRCVEGPAQKAAACMPPDIPEKPQERSPRLP